MGELQVRRPETAGDRSGADPNDLIDLVRRGDLGAFGELLRRCERTVFAVAFSICQNRAEAEDLTQDTLVTAYRSIAKLRNRDKFASWAVGIAFRKARSWRVRRAIRRTVWDRWFSRPVGGASSDPADEAGKREAADQAIQAIRQLPPKERLAVVLRVQQGMPTAEIARVLGITVEQARRAFERGLTELRRRLGGTEL